MQEEPLMQVLKPLAVNNLVVACWLPFRCPECSELLALAPTISGEFDSDNFTIVCGNQWCGIEYPLVEILDRYPNVTDWLPDGHEPSSEKFGRGREDSLLFGKGLGANQSGKARSEQMRYAIDKAAGWAWHSKRPNGPLERDRLYAMKETIGVFEGKPMKSALEMLSRKIERIERARNIKISEAMVDRISRLVRKGIRNAETRRPTTPRERRLIVEGILRRQGVWPP
jgi:hypothetical protein